MKKTIVLCADDYGQAPAISRGIINLLQKDRLSATSCMVNTAYWPEHAAWLMPFHHRVDIGLHFNLTEGSPLSTEYHRQYGDKFQSLTGVMRSAFLRLFSQSVIEAELHAQLDKFEQALGFLPDHIDGHQHVHQFPVIRSALIQVYKQRLQGQGTYIRLPREIGSSTDRLKKMIIRITGSRALKSLLEKNKISYNHSFAGIYLFNYSSSYRTFFQRFLQLVDNQGLIMCHPGLNAPEAADVIAKARFAEYEYFDSNQFLDDCLACEVGLERLIRYK